MNAPAGTSGFVPKQALAPSPALYAKLVGDAMEQLAAASLACIPAIPAGSVVHDVGCGVGAATAAVLKNAPSGSITVEATDINPGAVQLFQQAAEEKGWPVKAQVMDAGKQSFPDATFTHVIANALLFVLPDDDGLAAMKEIHRTLRPGGVAIANCWAYAPNIGPVQEAARRTRPEGAPLPRNGAEKWQPEGFIRDVAARAGFAPDGIGLAQREVLVTIGPLREFVTMGWSFIGGTGEAGWLESDEANWEQALDFYIEALRQTPGFAELEDGKNRIRFVANILTATK